MIPVWAIWLIISGVFLLLEIFTVSFLMFWPGIGAIFAFITSLITPNIGIQIGVFTISTIILIVFTKPLTKKFFKTKDSSMNNNAIIGKKGTVIKPIKNSQTKGQVKVDGELWSAIISDDEKPLKEGDSIVVEKIDGVKLQVKKA
ncbi:MAG: NfeD family protein [Clostridia bacterium]|nr:NfeD family protein [Clostridia bacterium]